MKFAIACGHALAREPESVEVVDSITVIGGVINNILNADPDTIIMIISEEAVRMAPNFCHPVIRAALDAANEKPN